MIAETKVVIHDKYPEGITIFWMIANMWTQKSYLGTFKDRCLKPTEENNDNEETTSLGYKGFEIP